MDAAEPVVDDNGLQLALVQQDATTIVSDLVVANAGHDLRDQLGVLDKLCRAVASRESADVKKAENKVREFITSSAVVANVDTKGLALSKHVHLRVISGRFTVLHLHDRAEHTLRRRSLS
jgi:hypothetical protein